MLIIRFCQGMCSGFIWPIAQIMVVEFSSPRYRTRALSLYQINGRFGALLSRLLLSLLLMLAVYLNMPEPASFKLAFGVAGLVIIIALLISFKLPPAQAERDPNRGQARSPMIIFVLAFVFGAMMAMAPISLIFINEYYHLSALTIAILLLFLDGLSMLAMYGASHLTDSIGIHNSLWFILIPCFISAAILPFMPSVSLFIVVYFIMRMAISSFLPLSRSFATCENSESGTNVGILNMMSNIGSVVGPIAGGLLYDRLSGSLRICGYSFIALLLIPASIVLIAMRRR
jgi:MFS family permease